MDGFYTSRRGARYVAAMNVGAIPFDVKNPTAYYAAPNKLWEYLSQGLTVAATPIPEVVVNKDFVNVVRALMSI